MVHKRGSTVGSDGAVSGSPARKTSGSVSRWSALTPPQRQVIASIRRWGSCNREQLGTQLMWSPSAVSKIVSPLLATDVILSTPPGARRRKAQLSPAADLGFAIGIELGFEKVRAAVVDFNGHIVGQKRDYRPDRLSSEAFLDCVQKVVRELLVRPLMVQVMGVGYGCADGGAWSRAGQAWCE